jgi:hypothetical protein
MSRPMPAPTCLVNDSRHEYLRLSTYTACHVGHCIQVMEKWSAWNARHDTIYVQMKYNMNYFNNYTDITDKLAYYNAGGGTLIHETFVLT